MPTSIENAKNCFYANQQKTFNDSDKEKHDLYAGLYALTEAVEEMQKKIHHIYVRIEQMR